MELTIERPRLRNLEPVPVEVKGRRVIALRDPYRIAEKMIAVPEDVFFMLTLFDGRRTVLDIQAELMRHSGELIFSDRVREIIEMLDSNYLLESDRFEARRRDVIAKFRRARLRPPSHAGGGYEASPARLRAQLDAFFLPPEGPGRPAPQPGAPPVKGIVAPHIDLLRGGHRYAWAWHALAQACDADTFITLGTAHVPVRHFFTATRKGFKTPLGTMPCDRDLVDALAKGFGPRLFEDEYVHKLEHAIEFQVIFLQHMLGARKARIVPVLCSSFLESAKAGNPLSVPEVKDFIAALKDSIAASGRRVCLVASADLAHVGPQFGDRSPLTPARLSWVEREDREMLKRVESLDADGFFQAVARDNDPRHICGLPPMYVFLKAIAASEGRLLRYAQAADPSGHSCVSFAAMSFS